MSTSFSRQSRTGPIAMPDDLDAKKSELCIRLYTEFRAALDAMPIGGRCMPYHWRNLPNPLGIIWMPYAQMLDEYAGELANIINDLTHHVHRLRAWATVVAPLSDEEKMEATHEFIDMLGTVALGFPRRVSFGLGSTGKCHVSAVRYRREIAGASPFPSPWVVAFGRIEKNTCP